ncbi:MAG: rhodanese-like domain-containing protein [Candidatus Gracilibacteria bacterium]|nr:rhodanese-like domain-containing protein [Candidatus Gracilibacteria bacterium]
MDKKYLYFGIVILVILFAFMFKFFVNDVKSVETDGIKSIPVKEFKKLIEEGNSVLIDIRMPIELMQTGIISGAQNIDSSSYDFQDKLEALDKNEKYLIYCRSGNRTGSVLKTMKQMGFSSVYDLKGGIIAWLKSGEKLIKN